MENYQYADKRVIFWGQSLVSSVMAIKQHKLQKQMQMQKQTLKLC